MRFSASVLLLGLLLACSGEESREAAESEAFDGKLVSEGVLGPVKATVHMDPAEPRFGDRIRFRLDVVADGARLEELDFKSRLGHFRVRGRTDRGTADSGRFSSLVEAEAERSGINIGRLPVITFFVEEGEGAGERFALTLPTFEVEVAGLAEGEEPDLAALGSPLGPVSLPADRHSDRQTLLLVGGAALLLIVALVFWRLRRRTVEAAPVVVDPVAEAERALAELLARGLIDEGRFGEFYLELTAIVCRYIRATTGIHAVEETTEEFLQEVARHPQFDEGRRRAMQRFLEASDIVKFAAQVPSLTEVDEAIAAARDFCRPDAGVRREEAA